MRDSVTAPLILLVAFAEADELISAVEATASEDNKKSLR
jgi:hypothetical protein